MLDSIYKYAKENKIPIMQDDGIEYLLKLIKERNIKNILEIGSAIGYSAIRMALVSNDVKVTTIEKDRERYLLAVDNIEKMNLSNRITIINDDALNTNIEGYYDLIFIDASKSRNIDFFEKYSKNLAPYGIIVTDNLSFHGLVEDPSLAITKNQKGIVRHIKEYIDFLDNNKDYITEYISLGDKISISKKKEE